jgi:hypothetical protein
MKIHPVRAEFLYGDRGRGTDGRTDMKQLIGALRKLRTRLIRGHYIYDTPAHEFRNCSLVLSKRGVYGKAS